MKDNESQKRGLSDAGLEKSAIHWQKNESKENNRYEDRTANKASGVRSDVNRSNKMSSFTLQEKSIGLKWK